MNALKLANLGKAGKLGALGGVSAGPLGILASVALGIALDVVAESAANQLKKRMAEKRMEA